MATKSASAAAPAVSAPAASQQAPVTRYKVVAPKGKLSGTKHGQGTAATHQALVAAANSNGGFLTYAQASAVCKTAGDPGFAAYAIRKLKVLVAAQ